MNMILKMIRHPATTFRYTKKYVCIAGRKIAYRIKLSSGYNFHESRCQKALKLSSVKNADELLKKWQRERGHAFIPQGCQSIFDNLSKERAFFESVVQQADHVLDNSFYILYEYVNDCQAEDGHYKWFEDYRTHYKYKMTFYTDARGANRHAGTDIKRVWEIARMQYLFAPALAYRLTHDEKYAEKVKDILYDFSRMNPKYQGPNWNPSMEIGIRAANIVLALELIGDASCVDEQFICEMVGLLIEHEEAILGNEENTGGKTSNHYLGGLLGLSAISTHLKFLNSSKKTGEYVFKSITREINTQILDDGGDYEGSTSYHRLVGELIGFGLLASRNAGYSYQSTSIEKLKKMAVFCENISSENGIVIQVGDNDSGRVFQLLPEDANDHRFMINLINAICSNKTQNTVGMEVFSILFGKKLEVKNNFTKESKWLASDFGIGRLSNNHFDLYVSCVNARKHGMGGHTHNDAGSFVFNCHGESVAVDPGSGNYTGDPELRNRLRSINSHSAIKINDQEQDENFGSGLFTCNTDVNDCELTINNDEITARIDVKDYRVNRVFSVLADSIIVKDHFSKPVQTASMVFVIAPEMNVICKDEYTTELYGSFGQISITGTWKVERTKKEYSPHYDTVVCTDALCFTTNKQDSTLEIRYISK